MNPAAAIDTLAQRVGRMDAALAAIEPADAETAGRRVLAHFSGTTLLAFSNGIAELVEASGLLGDVGRSYGALLLSDELPDTCGHPAAADAPTRAEERLRRLQERRDPEGREGRGRSAADSAGGVARDRRRRPRRRRPAREGPPHG